jgi:hypothetical protein
VKKATVILITVLLALSIFSNEFQSAYYFTYKVARYYGVSHERASILANTVAEEYEKHPQVPYQMFVALIVSESGFKNVYGDAGKAVGYCQLHEASAWYVATFYPEIRAVLKKIRYEDLIKFPELQIRIGYRYLYLIMKNITNWNIIEALNYWNNSHTYYVRVLDILTYIYKII